VLKHSPSRYYKGTEPTPNGATNKKKAGEKAVNQQKPARRQKKRKNCPLVRRKTILEKVDERREGARRQSDGGIHQTVKNGRLTKGKNI